MEHSLKTHPPDQEQDDDADFGEEVEVCDICGDAGYGDSLAICIRCNESAEHIYCMATMRDTVPTQWVCETCELKYKTSSGKRNCSGGCPSTRAYKKKYANKLSSQKSLTNQSISLANVLDSPLGVYSETSTKLPSEAGAVPLPANKSPPKKTIDNTASHYTMFPADGPILGFRKELSKSVSMKAADGKLSFVLPYRSKDLTRSKSAVTRPSPCWFDNSTNESKDRSLVLDRGHVHARIEHGMPGNTKTKCEQRAQSQLKTSSLVEVVSGSGKEDATKRDESSLKRRAADMQTMKGSEQARNRGILQRKMETEIKTSSPRLKQSSTWEIAKNGIESLLTQSECAYVGGPEAFAVQGQSCESIHITWKPSPAISLNAGQPSPDGRLQHAEVADELPLNHALCSRSRVSLSQAACGAGTTVSEDPWSGAHAMDAVLRADPSCEVLWSGSFNVFSSSEKCLTSYKGLQAHPSNKTESEVSEAMSTLPVELCLEELKRGVETGTWPRSFQENPPTCNSIGVYFFPVDYNCHDTWYKPLLDRISANDLALKSTWDYFHLLIFSSQLLPEADQCWEERHYLWGILKRNSSSKP